MGKKQGMQSFGQIVSGKGITLPGGQTKVKYKPPKDPAKAKSAGASYITTKGKTTQVSPGHVHKKW